MSKPKAQLHAGQLQLYPADKYSLYSTDTEERIISVDKGLERCAAMLKSLGEKDVGNVPQGVGGKKPDSKEKPLPTWRKVKVLPNKKGFKEVPKTCEVRKPRSGGVSNAALLADQARHYHTHPAACSTPDSKQGVERSKSKGGPRNMKEKRASSTPPPGGVAGGGERELVHCLYTGSTEDLQFNYPPPNRRNIKPHRRLKTEPEKVPSLRTGGGIKPPASTQGATQGRGPVKLTERSKQATSSTTHLPPPPPPLFHPYYHPYGFPYLPPYPLPYFPQFLPPDWTQEPPDHPLAPLTRPPTQTEALDLATLHDRHPYRRYPVDYYPHHGYYADLHKQSVREQDNRRVTADRAMPAVNGDVGSRASDKPREEAESAFTAMPPGSHHQVLDVESLDILLCELLNSCEEQVRSIRTECGSLLVGGKLDEVQRALSQCRQRLHQQCRRLAVVQKQALLSEPSATDWLPQIEQLEQERSGLIERLKESCIAYSEVRRTLDDLEKAKEEHHREFEEKKVQMLELQNKLDSVTTDFGKTVANLKMTKEELANIKRISHSSSDLETKLKDKNAALQQQVQSLLENVTVVSKEKIELAQELSHVRQSLETDQQMLKVALSEKNTQLLQAEDQLLGLRQCLAHFVSEVTKSCLADQHGVGMSVYSVTVRDVNKLRDLANNGNIEKFLAAHSEGTSKSSSLSFREGSPQSTSTVTGDEGAAPFPPRTELSSQINVITPLYSTNPSSSSSSSSLANVSALQHQDSNSQIRARGRSLDKSQAPAGTQSSENQPRIAGEYGYQLYPLNPTSSRSSVATDVKSSVTTSSEVDFRNNLASLDADIARLQMQFKVALQ